MRHIGLWTWLVAYVVLTVAAFAAAAMPIIPDPLLR